MAAAGARAEAGCAAELAIRRGALNGPAEGANAVEVMALPVTTANKINGTQRRPSGSGLISWARLASTTLNAITVED